MEVIEKKKIPAASYGRQNATFDTTTSNNKAKENKKMKKMKQNVYMKLAQIFRQFSLNSN